jgi:hypothetical protein
LLEELIETEREILVLLKELKREVGSV